MSETKAAEVRKETPTVSASGFNSEGALIVKITRNPSSSHIHIATAHLKTFAIGDRVAFFQKGTEIHVHKIKPRYVDGAVPTCGGRLISVTQILNDTSGAVLYMTKADTYADAGLRRANYVRVTEKPDLLIITAIEESRLRRAARVGRDIKTNNYRISLPYSMAEKLGLKDGGWIKSWLTPSGLKFKKLALPEADGPELVWVSKLFDYHKDTPTFIIPKRAEGALALTYSSAVDLYIDVSKRLIVTARGAAAPQNARLLRSYSHIPYINKKNIILDLPGEVAHEGFDIGDYVFVSIDAKNRRMILENAGLDAGEVPGKLTVSKHGGGFIGRVTLKRGLLLPPIDDMILLRTENAVE